MAVTFFLFFCIFIHRSYSVNYLCNTAFDTALQCATPTTVADSLNSRGYKALFQAPLSLSTTTIRNCDGTYSCAETQEIHAPHMQCNGAYSCSKSGTISAITIISGGGAHSLSYVDIISKQITCYGDQSCIHSTITSTDIDHTIYGYGSLSLYDTTINYNVALGTLNLNLAGYYAGYKAIVNCNNGAICNIKCYYNACAGLTLNCDTNACQITENGNDVYPPNTTFILDTNKFYNSTIITSTNEQECNIQQTDKTFDDYNENNNGDIVYNSDVGPICCRGRSACSYSKITYNSAISPSVICSGAWSCTSTEVISDSNNLIIECSGYYSCNEISILIYNGFGDYLYCYGAGACNEGNIRGISNVHCTGMHGCQHANISSFGNDLTVLLTGVISGVWSIITCNSGDYCNILCKADDSCYEMTLICDGTCFVECDQDTQCPNGWTATPTTAPTIPTALPSFLPTINPTINPSLQPIFNPTFQPVGTLYEITIEFDENADENEIKSTVLIAIQTAYPESQVIDINIENNEIIIELSISSNTELNTDDIKEKIAHEIGDKEEIKKIRVNTVNSDTKQENRSFFESFLWIFILIGIMIVIVVVFIYYYYRYNKKKALTLKQLNTHTVNGEFVEVQNLSPRVIDIDNKDNNNNNNIVKRNENESDHSDEEMYNVTQPTKGAQYSLENEEMYDVQPSTKGPSTKGPSTKGIENSSENEEMYDVQPKVESAGEDVYVETVTDQ
eukprot:499941_1